MVTSYVTIFIKMLLSNAKNKPSFMFYSRTGFLPKKTFPDHQKLRTNSRKWNCGVFVK